MGADDPQRTAEVPMPEDQLAEFAWNAWKKARRKLLAFAPSLRGLSEHKRRLLRRAALQDPVEAWGIRDDEEIAEELATTELSGSIDPVSKISHQTLIEFLPNKEGEKPKLAASDAIRLMMAVGALKPPASISPVLLLMMAVELHELADLLELVHAREAAVTTPRKSRVQENAALISAARDIRRRRPTLSVRAIAKILNERDEWRDLSVNSIRKRLAGVL